MNEASKQGSTAEILEALNFGLAPQSWEHQTNTVRSLAWYLDLPQPWPSTSNVRKWAVKHVRGPAEALEAIEAAIKNPKHPLAPMFDGWTPKMVADLYTSNYRMPLAWITASSTPIVGFGRQLRDRLASELRPLHDTPTWRRTVSRFADALWVASSGVHRPPGRQPIIEKADEQILVDAEALRLAALDLAAIINPSAADDPMALAVVAHSTTLKALSTLFDYDCERALASEDRRIAASVNP